MKTILAATAAFSLFAIAGAASADTINFGQFGGEGASLANSVTGFTSGGVGFTVTGPGAGFQILKQSSSWSGNFPVGTLLLFDNYAPGAMTFDFTTSLSSISQLAIESNRFGPYTATLQAYSSGILVGTQSLNAVSAFNPNSVPAFNFSSASFDRLIISTTNDDVGFALGGAGGTGGYAVPEPATWALMIGGFGLVGATLRRRVAIAA